MNISSLDIRNSLTLFLKRKDILIAIAIILISGFFAKNLYQEQKRKTGQAEKSAVLEKEKIGFGQEVSALNKEMEQKGSLYYKNGSSLSVEKLDELAALTNVDLVLVTPSPESDRGFCTVSSFKLSIKAPYHALGRFVSMVESQGGIVKIEEFSARGKGHAFSDARMAEDAGEAKIDIDMEISQAFVKK